LNFDKCQIIGKIHSQKACKTERICANSRKEACQITPTTTGHEEYEEKWKPMKIVQKN